MKILRASKINNVKTLDAMSISTRARVVIDVLEILI